MLIQTIPIFLLTILLCSGCAVTHLVKGEYYLELEEYDSGIHALKKDLEKDPESAQINYYLGRYFLARDETDNALPYLQKAVRNLPRNADYQFWLGVAYGSLKLFDQEREQYQKALTLHANHLQALTYLGHNYLQSGEYDEALAMYGRVLKLWPASPSALYNRALINKKLQRTPEEKLAFREYLTFYPSGPMARLAAENLNRLGDFSYRNYQIGLRTLTVEKIQFDPFEATVWRGSKPSLDLLGAALQNRPDLALNVIVYQKNNNPLAELRAKSIKAYLVGHFRKIKPEQIKISWFDVPAEIRIGNNLFKEDESVNFFAAPAG